MRNPFRIQCTLNGTPVEDIEVPTDSRHTIYPILRSLQSIYSTHRFLCHRLIDDVAGGKSTNRGAPGMTGWQILVMFALRSNQRLTFDDLEVMFNENRLVRQFLELDIYDEHTRFSSDTLQYNYSRVSPKTVEAISDAFLKTAMEDMGEDGKEVRSDSFVCQTNSHHPSDQSLLYDALRVILREFHRSFDGGDGWRQAKHLEKQAKHLSKTVSDTKKGKAKKGKKQSKLGKIRRAYKTLLNLSAMVMQKGLDATATDKWKALPVRRRFELEEYLDRLDIIFGQTFCRVVLEKHVPASDKLYSFFETHAALINRGKFPYPYEVGRRVVVSEGRSGLILDQRVMGRHDVDANETMPLLQRLKDKYGKLRLISLDRGYRVKGLGEVVDLFSERTIIPHWGKRPKGAKETLEDRTARWWRSGVESLISALQRKNGLDRCPDKGLVAMERWVAAGAMTRNMITYGRFLMSESEESEEKVA